MQKHLSKYQEILLQQLLSLIREKKQLRTYSEGYEQHNLTTFFIFKSFVFRTDINNELYVDVTN